MRGRAGARALTGARASGLTVVLLAALAAPSAQGYVRQRTEGGQALHWENHCIDMVVHNEGLPTPLTPRLVLEATRAAGAAWGRPGFSCTLLTIGTTATAEAQGPATNDGVNRVVFRTDSWCRQPANPSVPCYDPAMLAITTITARTDGTILDADIEVNAHDHQWADLTVRGSSGQDLQSALVHEFGHLVGLAHTCWSGESGDERPRDHTNQPVPDCATAGAVQRNAVMYPDSKTVSLRRILSTDDARAICQIYPIDPNVPPIICANRPDGGAPSPDAPADTASSSTLPKEPGGCSYGGRPPTMAAGATAAIVLMLLALRRRARS
jgi:hypothetical protein